MDVVLRAPDSLLSDPTLPREFQKFAQRQMNRLAVGHHRYGTRNKRRKYLTRLTKELAKYAKTGNAEQLLNIANYAFLEFGYPEHKDYHFDPGVGSVTRKRERGE
jgi:hypothetical protein